MADQIGLGKTVTELFALSWLTALRNELDADGKSIYRPTLINVPKQIDVGL